MIKKVEEFKDRLNKALLIRDIKPVVLSKKTGISESTISQYRSGYAKPKEDKLAVIANALDVNPAWLMGLDVPMSVVIDAYLFNKDTKPNLFEKMDRPTQEQYMEFIQAYLDAAPDVQKAVRLILKVDPHDL